MASSVVLMEGIVTFITLRNSRTVLARIFSAQKSMTLFVVMMIILTQMNVLCIIIHVSNARQSLLLTKEFVVSLLTTVLTALS